MSNGLNKQTGRVDKLSNGTGSNQCFERNAILAPRRIRRIKRIRTLEISRVGCVETMEISFKKLQDLKECLSPKV